MAKVLYRDGQFTLIGIAITSVAAIIGSAVTGWATADSRVSAIDTKIEVVQERENNHYSEVSKQLIKIDGKLDEAISRKR